MRENRTNHSQTKNNAVPHHAVFSRVIAAEAESLHMLAAGQPQGTLELLALLSQVRGSIIFTGIGKSGHAARLLAATFCSVGIPALFLHAVEALHGDVGGVRPGDVCCMISKSGSGEELQLLSHVLAARNVKTALISCQKGVVCKQVDVGVVLPLTREACGHDVVPTSSLLVALSFGHAVALQLAHERGFTPQVFGTHHPAGSLGKNLLLTVQSFMIQGDALPLVAPDDDFSRVVSVVTTGRKGMAVVCDAQRRLHGIVTDGDIRRACGKGQEAFELTSAAFMSATPKTIVATAKAREALQLMYTHKITGLVVTDQSKRVIGFVHMHDMVAAGITLPKEEQ